MQRVGAPSPPVECIDCPFHTVQARCQRFANAVPGGQLRFVRPATYRLIGVGPQVLEDGDGQIFFAAVAFKPDLKLRGDGSLQFAPGADAAEREFSSQCFLCFAHQVPALLKGLGQVEGMVLAWSFQGQGCMELVRLLPHGAYPAAKTHFLLFNAHQDGFKLGHEAAGCRVVRIGCHE